MVVKDQKPGWKIVTTVQVWVKARDAADFNQFAPVLQEWVDLLRKYAAAIDPSRPIYDVLLDDFEKGMTSSRLDEIFTEVCATANFWENGTEYLEILLVKTTQLRNKALQSDSKSTSE